MKYRKIISEAWDFTQNNKRLTRWYGVYPSILTLFVGSIYVLYQILAFQRSEYFGGDGNFWVDLANFLFDYFSQNQDLILPGVISTIVVLVLYFTVPVFLHGGLVEIMTRMRSGQKTRIVQGLSYGAFNFLPLFEYSLLARTFRPLSIITFALMIVRNWGFAPFNFFLPILIILLVIGFGLTVLFTYTEYFIIIDKKGVLNSISSSCALVIKNWQHTLLILLLMVIIVIRVLLNIIIVLLVPFALTGSFAYLATITLPWIGFLVAAIVTFFLLALSAHLAGTLYVFATSVWIISFLELTGEEELNPRQQISE